MKNQKKKGFTLIELIAVIAILAILGAILVPKISGYKTKASRSNYQASAKVIINAVKAHNADAKTADILAATDTLSTDIAKINANGTIINTSDASYSKLSGLTLAQIAGIQEGNFTLDDAGSITVTATGTID